MNWQLVFTARGWSDYTSWANDRKTTKRINELVKDMLRDPMTGIGKPEALRGNLSGTWSRRITQEHRLTYLVDGDTIIIVGCRFHYQ